jgi:putative ABC transport system substrate-binding protein
MRRRDFIGSTIGTTAAWPLTAHAQPRPARIVVLTTVAPPPGTIEAFCDGMRQRGYVDGQNILIEVRWPQGSFEQDSEIAAEMARSGADVIVAWPTPAAFGQAGAIHT